MESSANFPPAPQEIQQPQNEVKVERDAMDLDKSSPHPPATSATTVANTAVADTTVPSTADAAVANAAAPNALAGATISEAPANSETIATPGKEQSGSETPQAHFMSRQPSTGPYYGDDIGAPTRVWLNENVTPALVVAMRRLALERPTDPLRTLGQWLIEAADIEKRN